MTTPSSTTCEISKGRGRVGGLDACGKATFVMRVYAFRNLDHTTVREIRGSWFEEEEWFFRNGI